MTSANQENTFEKIKKYYLDVKNDEHPVDYRIGQSRKIVDKIYNHFMGIPEVKDEFYRKIAEVRAANARLKRANKFNKTSRYYNDSVSGFFEFLEDSNNIPKGYRQHYDFVYKTASQWVHGQEGEGRIVNTIESHINSIVVSFFEKNKMKSDFTSEIPTYSQDRITSVLNIKKEEGFFKRYQTIFAYVFATYAIPLFIVYSLINFLFPDTIIFGMILLTGVQLASWVTIVMGFYYTYKYVKKSKVILWRTVIFIIGIIINISLAVFAVSKVLEDDDLIDSSFSFFSEFNPDPSKKGTGILTIHTINENASANVYDSIRVPALIEGEELVFFTYIDFHNQGTIEIKNAQVKIHLYNNAEYERLVITGELAGDNTLSIHDTASIYDYNSSYEIVFLEGYIENTHADSDPEDCQGYNYRINFGKEILTTGVALGVLDTYKNGWCDQGYAIGKFLIRKKSHSN